MVVEKLHCENVRIPLPKGSAFVRILVNDDVQRLGKQKRIALRKRFDCVSRSQAQPKVR
jgi:hypothetical protein